MHSEENISNASAHQGYGTAGYLVITTTFVLGAIGNIAALWILYRSAKTRNTKHILMLKCLIVNDLVAVIGMLAILYLQKYQDFSPYIRCIFYVGLRAFGLVSGCVAFVMALERWLALTRPFLYQQVRVQVPNIFRNGLNLLLFVTIVPKVTTCSFSSVYTKQENSICT